MGGPGWHRHPLPGGSGEQALTWEGVGVIRKEPASVSVPAGPPSQRFHSPTTKNALPPIFCEAGNKPLDFSPRSSKSDDSYLSQSIPSEKNSANIKNLFEQNA